ncbi:AEC family transporter [Pseudomonas sp. xss_4]|uniref:Transporter n=1 Tax=Pseudomonas parafulva TaxID=157782 RepID=A0AAJ0PFK8_9PSED|nr:MULTISPECIES: AEC family transporter [Pseudomonas]KTT18240.1 transporter [Pseudomonas parafulva]MBH3343493.1 AEC family transporter [Pseudomonas parafulva]MEB8057335.1 AEC family transporter [Pseudomonas fulva]MEC4022761.1 AEC family transporter [Pseudomonas fulva]
MLHVLLTTLLPIILLIALGTLLRVRGFVAQSFWPGAERLSYYVLLPSLFLHGLATANLDGVPVLGMVAVLMLSTLSGALLLVLYQGVRQHDGADFTSLFQGGIRFNNYIGATLAAGIYGSAGIALAAVANAAIVPLVNLLCVLVFARFSARHSSPLAVLRAILANPLILGCAGGMLLRVTGLGLPAGIEPTLGALGHAALPLGLLCVGAALGGARIGDQAQPLIAASVFKFLVMPATTWGLCRLLGLNGQAAVVAVIFQALPTASSSYVMARQMGGNAPLMATIIAVQTVVAAATLPLVLSLLLG